MSKHSIAIIEIKQLILRQWCNEEAIDPGAAYPFAVLVRNKENGI